MTPNFKLQELADTIITGNHVNESEKSESGEYRVISPNNISNGVLELKENDYYINSANSKHIVIEKGDILISLIGPNFYSVVIANNPIEPLTINNCIALIKSKNNHYLNTFFNSNTGKNTS